MAVGGILHRLGRHPDPCAWPPHEYVGEGRFDDPARRFRVLYVAEQRRACFVEGMAQFRPSLEALARERAVVGAAEPLEGGIVPTSWTRSRMTGRVRLAEGQRWLDLRELSVRETLRPHFAAQLLQLGIPDLDLSAVTRSDEVGRRLTQRIAGWAYERRYQGVIYQSRLGGHRERVYDCRAIFEGSRFEIVGDAEPVSLEDEDLVAVAELFNLTIRR